MHVSAAKVAFMARNPSPFRLACFSFLCVALTLDVAEAQPVPEAPMQPTLLECRALAAEFNSRLLAISTAQGECMRSPPVFGRGWSCSYADKRMVNGLHAWSQCLSEEEYKCALLRAQASEVPECYERARKIEESAREDADALERANDAYESASSAFHDSREFLDDPLEFLNSKVSGRLAEKYFPEWKTPEAIAEDPRAEQLYRFLQSQLDSVDVSQNPVVSSIQKASLDRIFKAFRNTTNALYAATDQMGEIVARERRSIDSRRDGQQDPAPKSSGNHQPDQELCKILETC
jgi:hypothetical protein